ncbi:MAG: PepSY domain-containing protein [Nitrospirae bacterium]|nr:MAG: PepSY domain-containing protein [Nitrospirota bacterium]
MKVAGRRIVLLVALIGSALVLNVPAWSDEKGHEEDESKVADLAKTAKVTIQDAIKTASEKMAGTVIEAELERKHGKTVWEVEIVGANGKVTEVHVDAASGAVIDTEEKKSKEKKHEKKKEGKGRM